MDADLRELERRVRPDDPASIAAYFQAKARFERFDFTYLSYGGGVQSTALLAMCVTEEFGFPKPDLVVHARTQSELSDTDVHVALMEEWCRARGVPFIQPTAGSLERAQMGLEPARASGYPVSIPAYTESAKNSDGGMLRRQCTRHYKVDVVTQAVREYMGFAKGERIAGVKRVRALLGISWDEVERVSESREAWITKGYPLVDARMSRWHCEDAIRRHGLPVPPKSSCVMCPFHSDEHWQWMKKERPADFARAVAVDEAIRDATRRGADHPAYLHRRRLPLAQIDFDKILAEDRAQGRLFGDQFKNDCEGMCGV